jgi:hypothetical protein
MMVEKRDQRIAKNNYKAMAETYGFLSKVNGELGHPVIARRQLKRSQQLREIASNIRENGLVPAGH